MNDLTTVLSFAFGKRLSYLLAHAARLLSMI
jgi:hypothetical protein